MSSLALKVPAALVRFGSARGSSLLAVGLVWACSDDSGEPKQHDAAAEGAFDAASLVEPSSVDDAALRVDAITTYLPDAAPCTSSAAGTEDGDHDGFSPQQGDCNECDPNVNPGALDVAGNQLDEDCSGRPDDEPADCDLGLAVAGLDPYDAARALGLCRRQQRSSWGLVSARWVHPDGSLGKQSDCGELAPPHPLSRGLLAGFGDRVLPRQGASLLALSTGVARNGPYTIGPEWPNSQGGISPGNARMCTQSEAPSGFPLLVPTCNVQLPDGYEPRTHDGIALELEIKVPSNARTLAFDFDFFTSEFPRLVCGVNNDHFVALLTSAHPSTPANHNISFDALGNAITASTAFIRVCRPVTVANRQYPCDLGLGDFAGTGFGTAANSAELGDYVRGGATGWLSSRAPVQAGEVIRLRLAIWDNFDAYQDSTVLIDNFRWELFAGTAPVLARPETTPLF